MRLSVFKPSRRENGKRVISRFYVGQYSLEKGGEIVRVGLNTPDKEIAEKKLRDIVLEKQREREGLTSPRDFRDAAIRPLSAHLTDYAADLRAQERDTRHIKDTSRRIDRIFREIGWKFLPDISAPDFISWRSDLKCSAKTRKEYLVSLNAFLHWLIRQGKLVESRTKCIPQVETRGKQIRQPRAFTEIELSRLFAISGSRELVYRTLLYTGQRKAEVEALRWCDLQLEGSNPSAFFRAATMKDKESRAIPLPLPLVEKLREIQPASGERDKKVFSGLFPHYETFRADLKRAGIPHRDSVGHVVHFHSFRKTHASFAAVYGVAQKATQEVLGHSDANLTANIYTEIPAEAIRRELAKLPWIGENPNAPLNALIPGSGGQIASAPDKSANSSEAGKYLNSPLKSRIAAALDTIRQNLEMVDATGLEPVTPCV
jgi:integrase